MKNLETINEVTNMIMKANKTIKTQSELVKLNNGISTPYGLAVNAAKQVLFNNYKLSFNY